MRVTGGMARGRLLKSPKGMDIRPTTDKVRGAVFNILGQDFCGFSVLDLFAGTGSVGIEALSRGAEFAVFVDISLHSIKIIKENLSLCGYQDLGAVLRRDLNKGLPFNHDLLQKGFDLVFIDPPYGKGLIPPLIDQISALGLLSRGSLVVAECSKNEDLPPAIGHLALADTRIYGDTKICLYSNEVVL